MFRFSLTTKSARKPKHNIIKPNKNEPKTKFTFSTGFSVKFKI